MNPKVEFYFNKDEQWQDEFKQLRTIALDSGLTEDLKWGHPCYTLEKTNIFLMHGFKEYCALLFFKGALMDDPNGILIQQTENVQASRQVRFTSLKQIVEMDAILKGYIQQAIEVEKSGAKVEYKKNTELSFPEELQRKLDEDATFKAAFYALTPGRQRAYNLHFSAPKQSKTRESRIEKAVPLILQGKGLTD